MTDAESLAGIAGADIVLEGTRLYSLSDRDGRFELYGVQAGEHVLRVERIGYRPVRQSVRVPAGGRVAVDLTLASSPLELGEIVVSGARGGAPLRESGSSAARLTMDDVTERSATVSDLLQGVAAGVEITGGSGEAGQSKQIRLRGNGSMVLSNQPLVYIDGVRMMEGAFPADVFQNPGGLIPAGANVTTSPLDLVSVGDIDRIEIAKGPAATTLFGTGATNGVIQIFTRRGVSGPPRWTAEVSQGTGWVPPFGINGVDYLHVEHFLRDAWWGGGYEGGERSRPCVVDDPRWGSANVPPEGGCSWPGSQWYQTYRLAVDGGSRNVDYFASGEVQDNTHALPLDRLERSAFRTNLGFRLGPRLDVRVNGAYTNFWTSNTASGRSSESILLSTMRQERNLLGSGDPRDIAGLLANRNEQRIDRRTAGVGATLSQSDRVFHRLSVGYDASEQDLWSAYLPGAFFPAAVTTRVWGRSLLTLHYLGRALLADRGRLSSTLSFGGQLVSDDIAWTVRSGLGFANDVPTMPDEAMRVETIERAGSAKTLGILVQNVLDLSDRYFLTTGVHVDRLAFRGQVHARIDPRVGVAWTVSDEAFWPRALGVFRMRAAFGRSATVASSFVEAVQYLGNTAPVSAVEGGSLRPESVTEWEAGVDAAALGGRISLLFTGYQQTTEDALVPVLVDGESIPQRRELRNVGRVRNRGIELQLDATVLSSRSWTADVGLGIGTNHSEVLDLGPSTSFSDEESVFLLGYPAPVSRGQRVADPEAVAGQWSAGRYLTDQSGSSTIPLGPQLPTLFLTPALVVRTPGGIILSARGEYRGGNVRFVNPVPVSRSVVSPLCLPYYQDPATSLDLRADTPDLWRERCTPSAAADYWFDGNYFKLRSVAASIPLSFASPDGIPDPLLTITLANAFTWYEDIPWWDVEIPGNEGANGDGVGSSDRIPASTTLTLSLRVTF